jgi:hypothetical protein
MIRGIGIECGCIDLIERIAAGVEVRVAGENVEVCEAKGGYFVSIVPLLVTVTSVLP